MISRGLPVGFLLLGVALLGVAAFGYWVPGDRAGVVIEDPDRELLPDTIGQAQAVSFRIQNRTGRPVRVVGLVEC